MRAALELPEEFGFGTAEMMTQDAKRALGVAKAPGDVCRGGAFDKLGAEGLVLALGRGSGFEKEAGLGR